MPFADIENRSPPSQGNFRGAQHWFGQLFVRNWRIKLLALAVTLALWYGVTGQREPITRRFHGIQLTFRSLKDVVIVNQPRSEVDVTLTGSKAALAAINTRDLVVYVDVLGVAEGDHVEQLTPGRVHIELPEGVSLEGVDPNKMSLVLERRVERDVEVEVRLGGKLPDGYQLTSVTASPPRVTIRGAESHVKALSSIQTNIISLEGRVASFSSPQTGLDIADAQVDLVNPTVDVYLQISELKIEETFTDIRVQAASGGTVESRAAAATLYGPKSSIDKIRAEDLKIVLDTDAGGSTMPRLVFPPGAETGIEVRSLRPAKFNATP